MIEKISIREFARRLGLRESGIRKKIKDGLLTNQAVDFSNPNRPKIIPAVAVIELVENLDVSVTRSQIMVDLYERYEKGDDLTKYVCRGEDGEIPADIPEPKPKPKVKRKSVAKPKPKSKVATKSAPIKKEVQKDVLPAPSFPTPNPKPVLDGKSIGQIKKEQAEVKLAESKISLKRTMGKLVDKEAVYKELFGFGVEVKNAMLSIPDRIIDELLSCGNRNQAHSVLVAEINKSLELLSDINNRNL